MKIKNIAAIISAATLVTSFAFADDAALTDVAISRPAETAIGENTMIPVRKICEALGMTVEWNDATEEVTVKKGNISVVFTPDKDEYVINGSQVINLGVAPALKNDTTYVPFGFAGAILNIDLSDNETAVNRVVVLETGEGSCLVYDFKLGEVNVNITDETKAFDENGNEFDVKTLKKGQLLDIEYAPFMTASLPPMTNAVKITLADLKPTAKEKIKAENEAVYISNEDGMYLLYDLNRGEVNVNITDETIVLDSKGNAFDIKNLEAGQTVDVVYDSIMTMSIPPMTNALKITVKDTESKMIIKDTVAAVESDGDYVQIIVGKKDDVKTQTALNPSDNVTVKFADGTAAKVEDIKEDMQITVVASMASTKSIPQQRTAFNIVITK